MQCNTNVYDTKINSVRKCKNNAKDGYCYQHKKLLYNNNDIIHNNNNNDIIVNSDNDDHPDNNDNNDYNDNNNNNYEINKCCFCGEQCNPCSQCCGICARKMFF